MKRIALFAGSCLWLLVAFLVTLTGCSGLECADGTVEYEGECVLEDEIVECDDDEVLKKGECLEPHELCDDDTEYDETLGGCVAAHDEIECGEWAELDGDECVAPEPNDCMDKTEEVELDARANECVVTDEVCGDKTAFVEVDGEPRCVPTEEVCGGGEFDDDTGLCMPAFDCQPGDVVIDGFCVPELRELVHDAEYKADGNTDPDFGGNPVDLEVGEAGDEVVFSGVIDEPDDLNGDGQLDQIVDVFEFDAEQGAWFEISVRSVGLPNPAFIVESAGDDEHAQFERYSSVGTDRDKMRQIAIPEEGTYRITVLPEALITEGEYLIGEQDWDYLGTLEWIETPQAQPHAFGEESIENTIERLDQNLFVVDEFDAGNHVEASWEQQPTNAEGLSTVWTSDGEFIAEYDEDTFSFDVPADGEFWVVFDWTSKYGHVGLDYEVSADELFVVEDGEQLVESVSAEKGDVLEWTQQNDQGVDLEVSVVSSQDDYLVDSQTLEYDGLGRFVGLAQDDYDVIFKNTSGDRITEPEVDVDVISSEPITDFDETYTDTANENIAGQQDYYLVEFDEASTYDIIVDHLTGSGWAHLFVYELGDELIDSAGPSSAGVNTIIEFEADTTYVLRIGGEYGGLSGDYEYGLSFDEIDVLVVDDEVEHGFSADDGDVAVLSQNNDHGVDVEVSIVDDDSGDAILTESLGDGDTTRYHPLDEGDYTAVFTNDSGDSIYNLDADVAVLTPIEEKSFDTEDYDAIEIGQDNDDNVSVEVVVTDAGDDVVAQDSLSTTQTLAFDVDDPGTHTISYYQPGKPADEQQAEGIEFSVEGSVHLQDGESVAEGFSADENDVVEIAQTNDSGFEVEVTVTDDDTDEEVVSESLSDGDTLRHFPMDDGEFTATFENDAGESLEGLATDISVRTPIEEDSFDADGDSYWIGQENDEGASVNVMITEAGGDLVAEDHVGSGGSMELDIEDSGQHTIWYFQSGEPEDEQQVDGIEFTVVEVLTLEDGEEHTESISADTGDVIELTQNHDGFSSVEVTVTDDEDDVLVDTTLSISGLERFIGLTDGDYDVTFQNDSGETIEDFVGMVDVINPESADPAQTYTGSVQEGEEGEQDFYLVELDETATYDVVVEKTGGGLGWAYVGVYELGDDELATDGPNSGGEASVQVEFEADTPYVVRVGGDAGFNYDYTYELNFE